MKDWEIIADNLSKAGWSWGCVSAIDRNGRPIWITDAQRDDGKRFVVRADEKLTAFVELETSYRSRRAPGSDQHADKNRKQPKRPRKESSTPGFTRP